MNRYLQCKGDPKGDTQGVEKEEECEQIYNVKLYSHNKYKQKYIIPYQPATSCVAFAYPGSTDRVLQRCLTQDPVS